MQHFYEVYYEPDIVNYQLGRELREQFKNLPWIPIESHNRIHEMQESLNLLNSKIDRYEQGLMTMEQQLKRINDTEDEKNK